MRYINNTHPSFTQIQATQPLPFFLLATFLLVFATSCKKKTEAPGPNETGTVTDIENRVYRTVKIGSQWWMAEDLRTGHYNNGKSIPVIKSDTAWAHQVKGACCYKINNGGDTIGRFYNWYAGADSAGILAPAGWHIPNDDEWKQLESTLGMSSDETQKLNWRGSHDEGDKLKQQPATISLPDSWKASSSIYTIYPNNSSGFSALADGCRMFDGTPPDYGQTFTTFWWSTSNNPAHNEGWYRYLDY
ncbi:MAG TPA: fibrobacter succinogenes major paralogous domain-containing protein, partial [Ktedonobacteraceae bacterium]|nr:fibrobacter succinogenes major paralogous domain-containing protein [Ktedonobacteraceae bacterium]